MVIYITGRTLYASHDSFKNTRLYDLLDKMIRCDHMGMFVIPGIPNCVVPIRSPIVLVMIFSTSSLLTSKTPTLDLMTVSNIF